MNVPPTYIAETIDREKVACTAGSATPNAITNWPYAHARRGCRFSRVSTKSAPLNSLPRCRIRAKSRPDTGWMMIIERAAAGRKGSGNDVQPKAESPITDNQPPRGRVRPSGGVSTSTEGAMFSIKSAATKATQQAAAPRTNQPAEGVRSLAPTTSTAAPANRMPAPTPANIQPVHPARSCAARTAKAHPETPTSTNALATPAIRRNASQDEKDEVNAIIGAAATAARPILATGLAAD